MSHLRDSSLWTRHTDRQKTIEGIRENTKTCPEETILQLGNIDVTADASILVEIVAEYFEEFQRRYGSHIHILDWALHLDEGTPLSMSGMCLMLSTGMEKFVRNRKKHWKSWDLNCPTRHEEKEQVQ